MTKDASASTEAANASWISVGGEKSSKECTSVGVVAPNEIVRCTKVNSHFYRNFSTDSDTED